MNARVIKKCLDKSLLGIERRSLNENFLRLDSLDWEPVDAMSANVNECSMDRAKNARIRIRGHPTRQFLVLNAGSRQFAEVVA